MRKQNSPDARIFFVDSRFQKMARRPGGVSRDQAIERAAVALEELKPDFTSSLARRLQETITAIRQVGAHSGKESYLDAAYQCCGELRDTGATMGFELISFVSNNLCEILDAIRAGAGYHEETIECHIDALVLASKPPYSSFRPEQVPEMIDGLRRAIERTSVAPMKKES
jgi:hypothetical protein